MANTVNVRSGAANVNFGETVFRSAINNTDAENSGLTTNLGVLDIAPPNGAWAASASPGGQAKWVSYTSDANPTGNGRNGTPDSLTDIGNDQSILFAHTFTLGGTDPWAGKLRILADDTASVWLKDSSNAITQLFVRQTWNQAGNTFNTCSNVAVGCLLNTIGDKDLNLAAGSYTLLVQAFQINGEGFGINYDLSMTQVPEPGFYGVLALGMSGLFIAVRRRRAQKV